MEKRKLTNAYIDKVRNIEGFPIAKDEDIIALSDAPYYTACPNPFIEVFIHENGKPYDEATDDYQREPFAADVSEDKNDPIYNAHSYHTKVPHKAIMRYILHYTKPGDIVFDGFCGTGMTGVAAQICGNPEATFKMQIESEMTGVKWGARKAIISDLSPAATFIAYNYNTPVDITAFQTEAERIIHECDKECRWMYETHHVVDGKPQFDISGKPIIGRINYTVWSDVFICPTCSKELVFWDVAVDKENGIENDKFRCSFCGSELNKRSLTRAQESLVDSALNKVVTMAKQVPVLIVYSYGNKRFRKNADSKDLNLVDKIVNTRIDYWYPTDELIKGYNTEQPRRSHGIQYVHQFYTRRTLYLLSSIFHRINESELHLHLMTLITGIVNRNAYKCNRFVINKYNPHGRINGPKTGTLYIPSLIVEQDIIELIKYKVPQVVEMFRFSQKVQNCITTQSATNLKQISGNSIDYIFTDPPFGENINYSELNIIWETWFKVNTSNKSEAVINPVQKKTLFDYQKLMADSFREFYRILKPNRWITVEFHNSKNAVWNSIQNAMHEAGFIIADVRTLDKERASQHQIVSTSSVQQDLVISAYKPKESFRHDFVSHAGSEETAWSFVHQYLENLPRVVVKNGKIELITERQAFLLFDRMVAYRGFPVAV